MPFSNVAIGRHRYRGPVLPRHRHRTGYIELVLGGRFIEAGDEGRHLLVAGDVLVHTDFEAHLDHFFSAEADILNLPLPPNHGGAIAGTVRDLDAVARLAETDPLAASEMILDRLETHRGPLCDWPDLLAAALRGDPNLSIGGWADEMSLAASTVSRGFRAAYGCTAAAYRAEIRARNALRRIISTSTSLSCVAIEHGFSDQAHMTRTIRELTGAPPRAWRAARVHSIQDTPDTRP